MYKTVFVRLLNGLKAHKYVKRNTQRKFSNANLWWEDFKNIPPFAIDKHRIISSSPGKCWQLSLNGAWNASKYGFRYLTTKLIRKACFVKSSKRFKGNNINSNSNKVAMNKIENFIPNKDMLESHIQITVFLLSGRLYTFV